MVYPLSVPYVYAFSSADQDIVENGYLLITEDGNVLVDPVPVDEKTFEQITRLGTVSAVVLMTPGRAAAAQAIVARTAARLVEAPPHRQEIAPGVEVIRLPDQPHAGEFALNLATLRTVIVGDALVGTPAGALSLNDTREYADARKAALGLRRILRHNPHTLLLSRGHSLFSGAYDALYRLLYARAGAEIHRINLDELEFRDERDERDYQPPQYQNLDAEVGFEVGARLLGYRVSTLPPGHRFCPLHGHARSEELFFVIEGEPSVRMLSGTIRCRKGDFVALPVGESGTHQLINDSSAPATVLLLGTEEEFEACYYPDSDKLLVDMKTPLEGRASLIVAAHPELDYFQGEA